MIVHSSNLLGGLLCRYKTEILPSHKSHQVEGYRLKQLNQHFSSLKLTELIAQEVAEYQNIRLKTISPASLKRELTILSRVLTVASNDCASHAGCTAYRRRG